MTARKLALLLLLALPPLAGQAVAKQGSDADLRQGTFTSPMVLELPLDRLKVEEPGNVYPYTDQDRFVVDGVSLPLILITKSTTWSKQIKLSIKASAHVQPSYDRKVRILCSVVGGAVAVADTAELEISAKEKKVRSDSASLALTPEAFAGLFTGQAPARLKLIISVTPDR